MPVAVETRTWRGLPAWQVIGDRIVAVLTARGGHIAGLWAADDASTLSPLWAPDWPSGPVDGAEAAGTWGSGPEAPLLAGICGSNLCCDRFGGAGAAYGGGAGRPLHGEAGVIDWTPAPPPAGVDADFCLTVMLPLAGLRVWRAVALRGQSLTITTTIDAGAGGQYAEVAEHTTLGGTFLDGVAITADVDAVVPMPADGAEAAAPSEDPLAIANALAFPGLADAPASSVVTCRVRDTGTTSATWRAANARLGWALTARFARDDWPWLAVWTEHFARTHAPWAGKQRARGLELSTKPFPEGAPPPTRAHTFLGRPAALSLPAGTTSRAVELTWQRLPSST